MLRLLLFLFGLLSVNATVADCGLGKSIFKILDQSFSPEPPVAEQPYEYWFLYEVPEGVEVKSGKARYSVTLNGIPLPSSEEELCSQTFCPKVSGIYNESSKDIWPSGVSGKVVTKLEWYDSEGSLLVCSQTTERL